MVEIHKTTCCYCGVGCGVLVKKNRDGRISVEGDPEHPSVSYTHLDVYKRQALRWFHVLLLTNKAQ